MNKNTYADRVYFWFYDKSKQKIKDVCGGDRGSYVPNETEMKRLRMRYGSDKLSGSYGRRRADIRHRTFPN